MPRTGFKSVTMNEVIYDKIFDNYTKKKDELAEKGIFSFSGYVVSLLFAQINSL